MLLLFAGMESKANRALAKQYGVRGILVSAYYLRGNPAKLLEIANDFEFVMVDSGAFTYMSKLSSYQSKRIKDPKDPVTERTILRDPDYIRFTEQMYEERQKWARQYRQIADRYADHPRLWFVEFDAGYATEIAERRLEWLRAGHQPILVWHPEMKRFDFERYCRQVPYVGVGGIAAGDAKFKAQQFSWLLSEARKLGVAVHGFGMTQQEPMRRSPFYSVDSTSWLSGARYGAHFEWRNRRLRVWDRNYKHERKRLKNAVEALGLDHAKFTGDDANTLNHWNLVQWSLYAEDLFLSTYKRKQEYWHVPTFKHKSDPDTSLATWHVLQPLEGWERFYLATGKYPENYYDAGMDGPMLPEEQKIVDEYVPEAKEAQLPYTGGEMPESTGSDDEEGDEDEETSEEEEIHYDPEDARRDTQDMNVVMLCNGCALAERCFAFKPGNRCGIVEPNGGSEEANYIQMTQKLIAMQQQRVMRAMHFEAMEGGMIDNAVATEMANLTKLMRDAVYFDERARKKRQEEEEERVNSLPGPVVDNSEGEVEVNVKAKGGVLQQLLGNVLGQPQPSRGAQSPAARKAGQLLDEQIIDEAELEMAQPQDEKVPITTNKIP